MMTKLTRRPALSAFAAAAGIGAVALSALTDPSASRAQDRLVPLKGPATVKVTYGKPIPDFVLPDATTGKNIGFSTLSAGKKATVVIFMSTHCPVSNAYEGRIEAIATKYAAQGVQIAAIFPDVGEEAAEVSDHAKQHGLTFVCLRDETAKEVHQFGATVTPEAYVADAKGVAVYRGAIDDSQEIGDVNHHYLTDALDAVLSGKTPPTKGVRAFGCQIHLP